MENSFNLAIKLGDDALSSLGSTELSRILRLVADRIERGETSGNVKDINGNTVGTFEIIEENNLA